MDDDFGRHGEASRYAEEERARLRAEVEAQVRAELAAPSVVPVTSAAPPKAQNSGAGCLTATLLVIAGVFGIYACNSVSGGASKSESRALADQEPSLIRESCLDSVRAQLKAPSTAEFHDTRRPVWDGSQWLWYSNVDAQNGFGAMIRTNFNCTVSGTTLDDGKVQSDLFGE